MASARSLLRHASLSTLAGLGAVGFVTAPAAAHTGRGPGGVIDGLLHPITGADHLLAMVAVGVVAVIAVPFGRAWWAPAGFLGGMLAGGVAGMADVAFPPAEALILISVFILALAIAGVVAERRPHVLLTALVAAGVAHGHAHGAEAPVAARPLAYVGGFLIATAGLHLAGMAGGLAIRNSRTARLVTSATAVAGGALLVV